MNTHMTDIKNFFLAAVLSPFYAFQEAAPMGEKFAKGAGLTVALFFVGKGIDLSWQYYKLRREERRKLLTSGSDD
jgi:hypothetical protein